MVDKRGIARRQILKTAASLASLPAAARADDLVPLSMLRPGTPMRPYGEPSGHEAPVKRILTPAYPEISPPTGSSRTPLHQLEGIITPSGLHYERHHNGVPDIDPAEHRLLLHGLVNRPLEFSMEALSRYPRVSRIAKVEVSSDGGRNWTEAELPGPVLPQCLARFRLAWNWDGAPALLQSRATDEDGHVQPTRAEWVARFAPGQGYHYNAIQSWQVADDGTVYNVHA